MMSENEKDWDNPVFQKIYGALSIADFQNNGVVCSWLNGNGFANLTCCPLCHVDDFTHVEGCVFGEAIDALLQVLDQQKPMLDGAIEQAVAPFTNRYQEAMRRRRKPS